MIKSFPSQKNAQIKKNNEVSAFGEAFLRGGDSVKFFGASEGGSGRNFFSFFSRGFNLWKGVFSGGGNLNRIFENKKFFESDFEIFQVMLERGNFLYFYGEVLTFTGGALF